MSEKKIYSLSQVTRSIENVINIHCRGTMWIKADIVKLNYYHQSGHCFPDLVEKRNGSIVAQIRANLWSETYKRIDARFRELINEPLRDEMSVIMQAKISYHPVYGLALNILDIDPAYTLGEMARQKLQTIKRLKEENKFDLNKKLVLAEIPKTLAIISVESSKGYQDFKNIIQNNDGHFAIHHLLFPAVLQGENAISSISLQLDKIREHSSLFDAVVIVRGGGADTGLSCYDDYRLASRISAFPLPVLSGIGHSTNETVAEMVCNHSFITPTKAAEFIIQRFQKFQQEVKDVVYQVKNNSLHLIKREHSDLYYLSRSFGFHSRKLLDENRNLLLLLEKTITASTKRGIENQKHLLKHQEDLITAFSPENILKRGFSIARHGGKAITNTKNLSLKDHIEIQFYRGKAQATIETLKNNSNE